MNMRAVAGILLGVGALMLSACSTDDVLSTSALDDTIAERNKSSDALRSYPGGKEFGAVLDLSEDQKIVARRVLVSHKDDVRTLVSMWKESASMGTIKVARDALIENIRTELWPHLTDAQRMKLIEMKKEFDGGAIPSAIIAHRAGVMRDALDLSESQRHEVARVMSAAGKRILKYWNESASSRVVGRRAIITLLEADGQIEELLTAEQLESYKALKAEKRLWRTKPR